MGMTIEQIIKYLPSPICGDTVIGKEKQKEYDAHDSAVIILRKYQKIEQILDIEPVLTIPDNPTNGDMIKALFPNAEITEFWNAYRMDDIPNKVIINKAWWNAPYKEKTDA